MAVAGGEVVVVVAMAGSERGRAGVAKRRLRTGLAYGSIYLAGREGSLRIELIDGCRLSVGLCRDSGPDVWSFVKKSVQNVEQCKCGGCGDVLPLMTPNNMYSSVLIPQMGVWRHAFSRTPVCATTTHPAVHKKRVS